MLRNRRLSKVREFTARASDRKPSIDIAINKAFTARAFDLPTGELAKDAAPGEQFYGIHSSNHGRVMIFARASR